MSTDTVGSATRSSGRTVLRHPLEHPAGSLCAVALGMVGQLLLGRVLADATRSAERVEVTTAPSSPIDCCC